MSLTLHRVLSSVLGSRNYNLMSRTRNVFCLFLWMRSRPSPAENVSVVLLLLLLRGETNGI